MTTLLAGSTTKETLLLTNNTTINMEQNNDIKAYIQGKKEEIERAEAEQAELRNSFR